MLDAGTGTGFAAFAAARIVGDDGSVVGVDLAEAMVAEAERFGQGVPNVSFLAGDASHLPFTDARFDAVICSSALIYPSGALRLRASGCCQRPTWSACAALTSVY